MASINEKIDLILNKVSKLDAMEEEISKINRGLTTLTSTVNTIQGTVNTHTQDIVNIRQELEKQKAELHAVKTAQHVREQRLRATTLRVFNFPHTMGETVDNFKGLSAKVYDRILKPALVAAKAAGDLGTVPQQQTVLEACFRVYRREGEDQNLRAPVIIRLANTTFKAAIMKHRRCIAAPSDVEKRDGIRRFIVVEDLTPEAHSLLKKLQEDDRTDKVWSYNGVIHYSLPGVSGYKRVRNIFDPVDSYLPARVNT